jgi:hypothetical protein
LIGKQLPKYSFWKNLEEYENTGIIFLLFLQENAKSDSGARDVIGGRGSKDPTLERLMQTAGVAQPS